jgi:hypothetical protein
MAASGLAPFPTNALFPPSVTQLRHYQEFVPLDILAKG